MAHVASSETLSLRTHEEVRAWLEARGFDPMDLTRGKGKWRASPLTTAVILVMYYLMALGFVKTC